MCAFTPDMDRKSQGSPDRADALVYGLTEVLIKRRERRVSTSHQG